MKKFFYVSMQEDMNLGNFEKIITTKIRNLPLSSIRTNKSHLVACRLNYRVIIH
ncbi:MAG: hypothetical protein LBM25_04280 [Bacteroidales bacterium]|nr:hypothetical protein [Bacteroidales bacterium]